MKTMKLLMVFLAGTVLTWHQALAQTGVDGGRLRDGGQGQWLERLREENPEEYERLQKLRATDSEAFQMELRKRLAERRGQTGTNQERRGGRWQTKRFGGGALMFEKLRKESPEEYSRLMRLRQENQPQFLQELRKMSDNRSKEEEKCIELGQLYRETEDPAERKRIEGEMKAAVLKAFDAKIELHQQRLAEMEERLTSMRRKLEERKANRDAVCEERVRDLTRNPELQWESGW